MPNKEEILKLRSGDDKVMMRFCDSWLSCVVGKNDWKKRRTKEKISEIATPSDEAFALLVLENIWDAWMEVPIEEWEKSKKKREEDEGEAEQTDDVSQDQRMGGRGSKKGGKCRTGKYTKGYVSAGRYMGWTNEGLERYNQLLKQVKADREMDCQFEETYLERNKRRFGPKEVRKKYSGTETVISEEDLEAW